MTQKRRLPRIEAVFKSEEERQVAEDTLRSYNLTFSEYVRHSLCYRRLPPHSIDFPIYHVAVQFLWAQYRILHNLRYLRNQSELGEIPPMDQSKIENAIAANHQISLTIIKAIKTLKPSNDENTEWLLEHAKNFSKISTLKRNQSYEL